jgi:hypothetical protein
LVTGQVALEAPSENCFSRIARKITEWGLQVDPQELKEAYFYSKVLSNAQLQKIASLRRSFLRPRTSSPTPVSPSGQNTAEALPNVLQGQLRNTNTRNTYKAARSFFNFVSINLSEATPTVIEEAERRPKLLGKWKCNRLPTSNEVLDNTERRRSQSRAQACRSQWEGNGVRNSPTPGGTASETPKSPKGERRPKLLGMEAYSAAHPMRSWIIRNGGAHRAKHKPVVLNGRGTASEIRQPKGNGVRNS